MIFCPLEEISAPLLPHLWPSRAPSARRQAGPSMISALIFNVCVRSWSNFCRLASGAGLPLPPPVAQDSNCCVCLLRMGICAWLRGEGAASVQKIYAAPGGRGCGTSKTLLYFMVMRCLAIALLAHNSPRNVMVAHWDLALITKPITGRIAISCEREGLR